MANELIRIRTVDEDIQEFASKIDELSVTMRDRVCELSAELMELMLQPVTMSSMGRNLEIVVEQMEIDKRVRFLTYVTDAIQKFTIEQLGPIEEESG